MLTFMQGAFRPGTWSNHRNNVSKFKDFCLQEGVNIEKQVDLPVQRLCNFINYLSTIVNTSQSILNIISSIKLLAQLLHWDINVFSHISVILMLKSVKLNIPKVLKERLFLSPTQFRALCQAISFKNYGPKRYAVRLGLLLGYLGLFRRANIAPENAASFNPKQHTTKGDCILNTNHIVIRLKWSKTRQNAEATFIAVPFIPHREMNAKYNYLAMCREAATATTASAPLLTFPDGDPLTAGYLTKAMLMAAKIAKVPSQGLSLHTLRRSGSTVAQQEGATGSSIAKQGTWSSELYLEYILSSDTQKSPIQDAMYNAFR